MSDKPDGNGNGNGRNNAPWWSHVLDKHGLATVAAIFFGYVLIQGHREFLAQSIKNGERQTTVIEKIDKSIDKQTEMLGVQNQKLDKVSDDTAVSRREDEKQTDILRGMQRLASPPQS